MFYFTHNIVKLHVPNIFYYTRGCDKDTQRCHTLIVDKYRDCHDLLDELSRGPRVEIFVI